MSSALDRLVADQRERHVLIHDTQQINTDLDAKYGKPSDRGNHGPDPSGDGTEPVLLRASDVTPTQVAWLWHHRIPLGKITIVEGDPDLGKSSLLLDLAGRVSTGGAFPDGAPGVAGGVVILSAEDGAADTIIPRLTAVGAGLDRIALLTAIMVDGREEPITLPDHVEALAQAVRSIEARLVIIDPLFAYQTGAVNSWRDHDVRRAMLPLAAMAEALGVAVVVVRHWTKGEGRNAKYKGGGSIAYTACARAVYMVARESEDGEHVAFCQVKNNLAPRQPSLRYRLEGIDGTVRVVWCGESQYHADELTEAPEARVLITEAEDVIREQLTDRDWHKEQDVWRAVRDTGVSMRTYRRARRRLKVVARPAGWQGPSMLRLPDPSEADERAGMQEDGGA